MGTKLAILYEKWDQIFSIDKNNRKAKSERLKFMCDKNLMEELKWEQKQK